MKYSSLSFIFCLAFFTGCQDLKKNTDKEQAKKGSFGFDLEFISAHTDVVILRDKKGKACLITTPELQGRILTSSLDGLEGKSLGYVNHKRIASKEIVSHAQGYGGEDRFWLGPQGGQYTIFFKPGDPFDFEHWFAPSPIDKQPFEVVAVNDSSVHYRKKMILNNYVKTRFELEVNRRIRLIGKNEAVRLLNLQEIKDLKYVGFESKNEVINEGKQSWEKETGLLSIWILGMFPGGATVVIPYREGPEKVLGKIYSEYFGEQLESLTDEDVIAGDGKLFYNGSGDRIGKIGIGVKRAKSLLGSYDSKHQILTIVQFTFTEEAMDYVNSQWEQQEEPYAGDVINSYNDGALDRKSKILPTFYELESSSPAMKLKPGESMLHYHRTFHFQGDPAQLNSISQTLLGAEIEEIEGKF